MVPQPAAPLDEPVRVPVRRCGQGIAVPFTERYDVAVVGFGPTGVTAANLLGAEGLRVLVLERDPGIYDGARAISTDEEVVRSWQSVGLAERLTKDMLAQRPIDFVDAQGRPFLSFTPHSRGNGHPPQLFLYQPAMERVLREGVTRYPRVDVLLEHECLGIRQFTDEVELTVRAVGSTTKRTLVASYVVAADGGSSPIRAQLGVDFTGRTYPDRWAVVDTAVRAGWPECDRLRFHCTPQRPVVDCPTPFGRHRFEFPLLAGEDEADLVDGGGVRRVLAALGIADADVAVLRTVVYRHHVRVAARWRLHRVFLAGDAAHVMPPYLGQGMAAGVRDAANLCWKLAAVVRGELPDSLLDTYERERQPHVRAVTRATILVGRLITERRASVVTARTRLLRWAMRTPGVGNYLREARWFPATSYAGGFRASTRPPLGGLPVRVTPRRQRSPVGRLVPQPWVLDPAGRRVLLDEALGAGWSVLALAPDGATKTWADLGVRVLRVLPAGSDPAPDGVVDTDGTLSSWLRGHSARAVALRPDRFVYAAAERRAPLAAPPFLRPLAPRPGGP